MVKKIKGLFHNIVEMIQFLCSNDLLAASHLGKSSQIKFALYLTMRNITRGEFVKNGGKVVCWERYFHGKPDASSDDSISRVSKGMFKGKRKNRCYR